MLTLSYKINTMLSAFPSLLSYNQIAPLLLRIILGAVFLYWAFKTLKFTDSSIEKKALGLIETLCGVMLVIGLWTQVAAIVAFIDLLIRTISRITKKSFLTNGVNYYLVLLVVAFSIIVLGAGWYSFDLPL